MTCGDGEVMNKQPGTIRALFLTFLKIGAFTFGGGYAMIPLIQKEVVERRKWMTDGDILDIIAIAESTPGPIAVNTAGVLALICKALVSMYRQCPRNLFSYLLAGAAFLATAVFRVNVLLVILGCAACGLVHSAIVGRKQV